MTNSNYMKNEMMGLLAALALVSTACGNHGNGRNLHADEDGYGYVSSEGYEDDPEENVLVYECPMCMSNGKINHYYTGELMECPVCEGDKYVSEEVVRKLQEGERIGRELANEWMGISPETPNGGNGGGSGYVPDVSDIDAEIAELQREIDNIQSAIVSVESETLNGYYSNYIIQLQGRIRQLESMR